MGHLVVHISEELIFGVVNLTVCPSAGPAPCPETHAPAARPISWPSARLVHAARLTSGPGRHAWRTRGVQYS